MRLDQEALADAAAAELTTRQTYAEQLVAWARNLPPHPAPRLSAAVGLWEGPSQLRLRIALLLDEHFTVLRNSSRRLRLSALALAIAAAFTLSTVTIQPPTPATAQDTAPTEKVTQHAPTTDRTAATKANDTPRPIPNTILGRTLDENGQPIAGAEVFLLRVNRFDSARRLVAQKTSDDDGSFRFDNVVDVAKEFTGRKIPPPEDIGEEFIQTVVRAPGRVSDFRTQLPQIVAKYGDGHWVRMPRAATLQGRITGPDGKPVRDAFVAASSGMFGTWEGIHSARTDADGRYTISDVAPFDGAKAREQRKLEDSFRAAEGEADLLFVMPATLTVEHPNFAMTQTSYDNIPGTKDVQLAKPAVLEGRVIFADTGKPASGVVVQAATSNPRGILPRMDQINSQHRAAVRANADGNYRFTTLPAGTYDLWAEGGIGRAWKMPAAAGTYDVWAQPADWVDTGANQIAATADKTTTVPDLKLIKGALVQVRLVDAKTREPIPLPPDTSAMLVAVPPGLPSSRPAFQKSVFANADGKFEIRTLPGENRIVVGQVQFSGEPKWIGSTGADGTSAKVIIENGTTTSIDVPVRDSKEVRADATIVSGHWADAQADPRKAVDSLTKALKEQPDDTNLLIARSGAWHLLGEYEKEVEDLEHLIQLNPPPPKNLIALNNLAVLLSTAPEASRRDGKRAIELARRAQATVGQPLPDLLDTLAAAYAETGDFDEAAKTQEKAIELAPAREEFRNHLELYRANQPLRLSPPATDQPKSDDGAVDQPVDIPIIVAKHVLLHDGKIIEWADVERLVTTLPNPKLARPKFYFTYGSLPQREEEIREKIWDFRHRQPLAGHTWASIQPRTSPRYDAVRTAADLIPNKEWLVSGRVDSADGLPLEGAEVVLITPVDESLPYKTADIYIRNHQLRQPLDEIVTTTDGAGHFEVYPAPDTPYYLVALHKSGYAIARSDEFTESGRIQIEKWPADIIRVPAIDKWPEIVFHLESDEPQPTESQTEPASPTLAAKSNESKTNDISGQVLNPDGSPAVGVPMMAFRPYDFIHGKTDDAGRFKFNLPADEDAIIWIRSQDYCQQVHYIAKRRGDLGTYNLENGIQPHGRVVDADGKPLVNVWVNARPAGDRKNIPSHIAVAEQLDRSATTDEQGRFSLAPLPPGKYVVVPTTDPDENVRGRQSLPLPAAFVNREFDINAASELDEIELRAVPSHAVTVQVVDSRGKPAQGFGGFFLQGTLPDSSRFSVRLAFDGSGKSVEHVPRGLKDARIDIPYRALSIRHRSTPGGPLGKNLTVELGTIDRDRQTEIVRYREPILKIDVKDQAGNRLPSAKVAAEYKNVDAKGTAHSRNETRQVALDAIPAGGWETDELVPDEKFTLTVTADGYEAYEETRSLAEGEQARTEVIMLPLK